MANAVRLATLDSRMTRAAISISKLEQPEANAAAAMAPELTPEME
jgi:hypothetical protein